MGPGGHQKSTRGGTENPTGTAFHTGLDNEKEANLAFQNRTNGDQEMAQNGYWKA
jgi:hypothetical protein